MKVIIIGANGQLGSDLCQELKMYLVIPLLHRDIEVSDMESVKKVIQINRPDAVVNTAVCHTDDSETNPDKAYRVNALGARNIAVMAQEVGAKLIYVSSDYVFGADEQCNVPYNEFDFPAPINICGRSKLAGEIFVQQFCQKHFIIRTSALFGVAGSSGKGGNFVETMVKLAKEREELRVVNDQITSPTYTKDLARKITQLINTQYYGTFHITNRGACSWYEFTREILKQTGSKTPVIPISSAEYPTPAKRPRFSVLDNYNLRLLAMDDMRLWQDALKDYLRAKGYTK
ncbi:MAG: dTDP-4-dehydrorhamnose reductase [Dehalococcoidia bacterium]